MKITNNSQAPKPAATTGTARARASGQGALSSASSASAVCADPSARVAATEPQVSSSDFSATKVNAISSAIAAGTYQVNAGAVADKLLANTEALAVGSRVTS